MKKYQFIIGIISGVTLLLSLIYFDFKDSLIKNAIDCYQNAILDERFRELYHQLGDSTKVKKLTYERDSLVNEAHRYEKIINFISFTKINQK